MPKPRLLPRVFAPLLLAILAVFTCHVPDARAERRVGLVIGINAYPALPETTQLVKAVPDARAVRDLLKSRLGFHDVVYGENTTLEEARNLLLEFSRRLGRGDLAFVFFAGHGMNVRLANYLLPSDLPSLRDVSSETQVRMEEESMVERSISEERVRELISIAGARAAIIVIDACRNNIFREALLRGGPRSRTLAQSAAIQGARPVERAATPGRTQFLSLYSASPGQRALDSLGGEDRHPNSPFTRVLVERLPTPGTKVYEIMRGLRSDVVRMAAAVGHDQVPAIADEALDEVVLVPGSGSTGAAATVAPAASAPAPIPAPAAAPPLAPPVPVVASPPPASGVPNVPARPSGGTANPVAAGQLPASRAPSASWDGWRLVLRPNQAVAPEVLAVSPNSTTIAVAYRDRTLRFWSTETGLPQRASIELQEAPSILSYDDEGRRLLLTGKVGVEVWDIDRSRRTHLVPTGREGVSAAAFADAGKSVVIRESRGTIRRFDLTAQGAEVPATPENAALLGARGSRSVRDVRVSASIGSGLVRVQRGQRGRRVSEAMALVALPGGNWIAIDEDGLSFAGTPDAIRHFDLVKGRDRLPVSEDFLRAYNRPRGLVP